jgi:SAM-dependent methyltransferase
MLERARREQAGRVPLSLARAEAERLPLGDSCVDYVFCYALMKHLPPEVKRTVLREFARVARHGVVASFAVFNPLTWLRWRWMTRQRQPGPVHSYPVWSKELEALAREAGLRVARRASVLGWLSLEKVVYLEKPASGQRRPS